MKQLIWASAALSLMACGGGSADEGEEIASGTITGDDGEKAEYTIRGDEDKGSFSVKTDEGSFSINAGGEGSIAKLPFGFQIPANAKILSNVQMNSDKDGAGSMVTFETGGSPDAALEAFKKQAKSKGFEVKAEMKMEDTIMFNAVRGDKESVNVSATSDDGKTTVNVIAGTQG